MLSSMLIKTDINRKEIYNSLYDFIGWLDSYGKNSYDQFDFWGSSLGVYSKKIFLKNKFLAAPIVLSLQLLESFIPSLRYIFAKKQRFAIGDANFALGYLNLFRLTEVDKYLIEAKNYIKRLIDTAAQTENGIGWGYPYTWVSDEAIYPPNTPFITVTPYAYYAIKGLFEITNDESLLPLLRKTANYAAFDLNENKDAMGNIYCSYSPIENSCVFNANTYRAALLLDAFSLFGVNEFKTKSENSIKFVLNNQNKDGSWYYALDSKFIDNFHTCFILKNLYKSYLNIKDPKILLAVKKGYDYYKNHLIRKDGSPIHFALSKYPKFRYIEMYDYAEGILLGELIGKDFPEAKLISNELANQLIKKYQLKDGHFITRISSLRTKNRIPYLRWPQAQLFYSLTELLKEMK